MRDYKGYFRKDGTWVGPHQDSQKGKQIIIPISHLKPILPKGLPPVTPHPKPSIPQAKPYTPASDSKPNWAPKPEWHPKGAKVHPQPNEKGKKVWIDYPTAPTGPMSWYDPDETATFLPGGPTPKALHGVPFKPWAGAPKTIEEWEAVPGQIDIPDEPTFQIPPGLEPAAGVVIEEPDGRVWVVHPTNGFGGYKGTFPKGHTDDELDLQASAIKEAYEECGLQVEITGHLIDVERTTTVCRYYTAKRVGGTPAAAGWESQAVSLVPREKLYTVLNSHRDYATAQKLGAGAPPPPPPSKWPTSDWKAKLNEAKAKTPQPGPLFDDL